MGRVSRFRGGVIGVLAGGAIAGGVLIAGGGGGGGSSFPDASNTGVPTGTTLTAYSGPNPVTTNNTVIDSKLITSALVVNATGVTIQNSRITVTPTDFVGVQCEDGATCGEGASPLTIKDSTIDCSSNDAHAAGPGTAVTESNLVLLRVDIFGCENGLSLNGETTITDSWIHDLYEDPTVGADGTHTDGIQFSGSHFTSLGHGGETPGIRDVTIQHNTIEGWGVRVNGTLGALTTSAIITNRGPTNIDQNILINNNLLSGGGNTIYCEQDGFAAINERVTNNRFSEIHGDYDTAGAPNRSTDCSDESDISGNVDDATGSPVSLP